MSTTDEAISTLPDESIKDFDEKRSQSLDLAELDSRASLTELSKLKEALATEQHISREESRRLVRKIDIRILPFLMIIFGLQFADKVSLGYGVLFNLKQDTNLHDEQYSWLTTIYYMGFMIFQPVFGYVMQRYDAAYVVSSMVALWGVVLVTLGLCNNFAQLMAVRFILGSLEGVVYPAFALIVVSWYKRSEQNLRQLLYFSMLSAFAMWVSVAIYFVAKKTQEDGVISGWRAINFLLGSITTLFGVLSLVFLRLPSSAWWLSAEEKKEAHARILDNGVGSGEKNAWKWDQVRDAFTDPTTYFIFFIQIAIFVPNGGITTYQGLIYQSFGFTAFNAILFQIPMYGACFVWLYVNAFVIHKKPKMRWFFMCFNLMVSVISLLVVATLEETSRNQHIRYALFLFATFYSLTTFLVWGLMPSIIGGRTKKTIVNGATFVGFCIGNMIGPQVFTESDAPLYRRAMKINAAMLLVATFLVLCWLLYIIQENKRRRKVLASMGITEEERILKSKVQGELDITDNKNIYFLYNW